MSGNQLISKNAASFNPHSNTTFDSNSGTTFIGVFVRVEGSNVVLRANGTESTFPIAGFIQADQDWIAQQQFVPMHTGVVGGGLFEVTNRQPIEWVIPPAPFGIFNDLLALPWLIDDDNNGVFNPNSPFYSFGLRR